ncbi:MAG: hypothetical protein VZT48_01760 [Bulleidia sp.]|nr:hypothetical protein [Bulleidia sp.]
MKIMMIDNGTGSTPEKNAALKELSRSLAGRNVDLEVIQQGTLSASDVMNKMASLKDDDLIIFGKPDEMSRDSMERLILSRADAFLQSENNALQKDNTALKEHNDSLQESNQTLRTDNASLKESNDSLQKDNESLKESKNALQDEYDELNRSNDTLRTINASLMMGNENLKKSNATLQSDNDDRRPAMHHCSLTMMN